MFTYEDLLSFVEANDYQNKPFSEVLSLYEKEMRDCYESMLADDYNCSLENHERMMI